MSASRSRAARAPTVSVAGLAVAVLACLFCCASASAGIVTIGSSLQGEFTQQSCASPCTVTQTRLNGETLVAPTDGAIVRWRLLGGTPEASYRVRAVDPLVGSTVINTGSSPYVVPQEEEGVETFPAALTVRAGQQLALDIAGGTVAVRPTADSSYWYTSPPALIGASEVLQPEGESSTEIGYDADFLPAPTVSGYSPTVGSTTTPTPVTITGSNLLEVTRVDFDGTPASFQPGAESTLRVLAPPGVAGNSVPVTVVTPAGASTAPVPFAYPAPICTVPKLVHRRLKAARKGIRGAHCRIGKVWGVEGVTTATGRVLKQSPKPGTVGTAGTKVSLKLG